MTTLSNHGRPHMDALMPDLLLHEYPLKHWKEVKESRHSCPEPLFDAGDNVHFGLSGRHYPHLGQYDVFTNPPRRSVGQIATGDVIQISCPFGLKTGRIFSHNIFNLNVKQAVNNPTLGTIASDIAAGMKTIWEALSVIPGPYFFMRAWGNVFGFFGGVAKALTTEAEEAGLNLNIPAMGTGNNYTGLVPLRSAMVVSISTAKKGRSFHGRCYFPAVDEHLQNQGNLGNPVAQANAEAISSLFLFTKSGTGGGAGRNNFNLGIWSPTLSKKNNAIVWTPATASNGRDIMGSQRGRQDVDVI